MQRSSEALCFANIRPEVSLLPPPLLAERPPLNSYVFLLCATRTQRFDFDIAHCRYLKFCSSLDVVCLVMCNCFRSSWSCPSYVCDGGCVTSVGPLKGSYMGIYEPSSVALIRFRWISASTITRVGSQTSGYQGRPAIAFSASSLSCSSYVCDGFCVTSVGPLRRSYMSIYELSSVTST